MKKALAVVALSTLLATPALADTQPAETPEGGLAMKMKGVSLNIGGFIEAATIYRARNLNSDVNSTFTVPKPSTSAFEQDETRFSARQSRLSILASGDATPNIHLAGYYEMDFLGAAQSANQKESNSYNPRVRHLYTTVDWDSLGLHLLAGQSWSLVTMNSKGITPRNEVTPLTIEAQYVPGFSWARQAQIRIVKDFGKTLWLAVSAENPQTVSVASGNNASLTQAPAGGLGASGTTISQNSIPDVVFKAAYEAGFAHLEVYDLLRGFNSTISNAGPGATSAPFTTTTTVANSVGGGVILQLVPDHLKVQVSGMYGRGNGRYGSGQLSDVTLSTTGNIIPLNELQLLAGVVYDPTKDWNFYGYYGMEQAESVTPVTVNGTPAITSGYGGSTAGAIQRINQGTAGLWWKFLQGSYGRMQAGLQYSYTENKYFSGSPVSKTANNMVFTSIRYYWQ